MIGVSAAPPWRLARGGVRAREQAGVRPQRVLAQHLVRAGSNSTRTEHPLLSRAIQSAYRRPTFKVVTGAAA
jgi:hypothetical protein